jgi:hypothetical protein
VKTSLLIVNEPASRNVPLVSVRKPRVSALSPRTVNPDASSVRIVPEPLLAAMARTSVTGPLPVSDALASPVNVRVAPARLPLVLRSSMPWLVTLPPSESVWPVWVPVAALANTAPGETATPPTTVRVRAVEASNRRTPETPWPTVRL